MDFLKFKLATLGKPGRQERFNYCDPLSDMSKPEVSGMIPSPKDYLYGLPGPNRNENVSLICSNTFDKNNLVLKLTWRPSEQTKDITTLLTDFKLTLKGVEYSYDSIETYRAQQSTVRLNHYTQYGSSQSSLKLVILSPYRRMRLVFRGYMKRAGEDKSVFVKLNFILTITSATFDFLEQYNPDCFRESYNKKPLNMGYSEALNNLILHDCHEHSVRLAGECSIREEQIKETLYLWGFYSREFVGLERPDLKRSRLMGFVSNGQLFHIGYNQIKEDKLPFGYTCYSCTPYTHPIDKPFEINTELDEKMDQFEVEVFGEGVSFKATGKKIQNSNFFEMDFNQKAAWAYLSVENTPLDSEKVHQSQSEYLSKLKEGRIVLIDGISEQRTSPLITNTDETDCCCNNLVGSKAASLAQLKKFQANSTYKVPHAFVLTRFAYDALLEHNKSIGEAVSRLEEMVGEAKTEGLREECERLRKLVEESSLPDELVQQVAGKLEQHYGKDELAQMKFAVRSSSWGEDEEDMSAAGQLTTILAVQGSIEAISQAVLKCFGSKFSYENIQYKRQRGLPLGLPMAVVIQEMVDCDKAGVMFTCDPRTGDDRCILITGNYGLGESVVGGQAEPDTIKIKRKSQSTNLESVEFEIEDLKVGSKSVVVDEETLKGSKSSREYDRTICCLTESESLALAEVGHQLSQYYQFAVDVEWGFKGDQLYLLQTRPITGLDTFTDFELLHETDFSRRAEMNVVTRANIGEVLPYASKPFTLTYLTQSWSVLGAKLFSKYAADFKLTCTTCPQEVFFDAYHAFFSLANSVIFQFESGEDMVKKLLSQSMQVAFFGRVIEDTSDIVEASRGILPIANIFMGPRYEFYTFMLRKRPLATVMKPKKLLASLRQQVSELKLATGYQENKLLGLYNQVKNVTDFNYNIWENHILIVRIGGAANMELTMFLSKYIRDPNQLYSTSAKFFATSPDVISAQIPVRVEKMTELIKAKEREILESFASKWSPEECLEFLKTDEQLSSEYKEFLQLFGHRAYNEFELAESSWAMNQSLIVEMLKKSCLVDNKVERKSKASVDEIIKSIEADCGQEMETRDKFYLKQVLVPKVQTFVAARERTKDVLVEFADITRQSCRMLAVELRRNLRIPDEDLFFYLLYEELEPIIREPQPSIVMHAIRRRNIFKQFSKPWLFDELVKGYAFIPNHLKPSRELDEKISKAPKLYGTPASSGKVEGRICLVEGYEQIDKVRPGDILLTHSTDIAFSPVFPLIKGIITEVGGLISHGAVVARENGLPSILGIPDICRIIKDGEEVILDADNGVIIRLSLSE